MSKQVCSNLKKPFFTHDCSTCQYLGSSISENKKYDLYYCNAQNKLLTGTLIARYGNHENKYLSGLVFATSNPIIALAATKAIVKGILPLAELIAHNNQHN